MNKNYFEVRNAGCARSRYTLKINEQSVTGTAHPPLKTKKIFLLIIKTTDVIVILKLIWAQILGEYKDSGNFTMLGWGETNITNPEK